MSGSKHVMADGSSFADATRVRVDRADEPLRWRCPNGHVDWDRTNNHIWCSSCRRQCTHGDDVSAEHYEIVDAKTGRTIPWSRVNIVGEK